MFIFCRVLCFHSPSHKTHVICLTRDKSAFHHQSNVPPVMTAVTVKKEDRGPPPLIWTKPKKTAVFPRETVPNDSMIPSHVKY